MTKQEIIVRQTRNASIKSLRFFTIYYKETTGSLINGYFCLCGCGTFFQDRTNQIDEPDKHLTIKDLPDEWLIAAIRQLDPQSEIFRTLHNELLRRV